VIKITKRVECPAQQSQSDTIELDFDSRKRGRLRAQSGNGVELGLFLDRGRTLLAGDWLRAENGHLFQVIAAAERVTKAGAENPLQFARICYHLGNRHVPLQIGDHWLRFQPDHVLEELCRHYGLTVTQETAPFQPENGAYGEHKSHHHHHDDDQQQRRDSDHPHPLDHRAHDR